MFGADIPVVKKDSINTTKIIKTNGMENSRHVSVWSDSVKIKSFPRLEGDRDTGVLVVGGGMAGLLCARLLRDAGVDCILAEAKTIGGGVTANTTAKITAQHGLIYHQLAKSAGAERARMYYEANRLALRKFMDMGAGVACGLEVRPSYVYSLHDRRAIENETAAAVRLGCPAAFVDRIPLPFDVAGAVRFDDQAQFNPLRFIAGIVDGLTIYESTFVRGIKGRTAITDRGSVTAQKIVIATHFPLINTRGLYFLKMYQHRSYVVALEGAPDVGGMYLEEKADGLSLRNDGNLLLVGGGDHRTGRRGGNWGVLRDFTRNTWPGAIERYAWATQDCVTLDNVPYIGYYSRHTPDWYVAAGFNKWGMTGGMAAAMMLTDLITGKRNDVAAVFSPSRNMLRPRLAANGCAAAANLLTPTAKRCPHMGCALKWNRAELTWDCPCHGSRFDRRGALIDNPAKRGLKIRK